MEEQLFVVSENAGHLYFAYDIYKFSLNAGGQLNREPIYRLSTDTFPCNMGFFCCSNEIFIVGGESDSRTEDNDVVPSDQAWVFNTESCSIESITAMATPKIAPICIGPLDNGLIYVFNMDLSTHACDVFDPNTKTWRQLPPPPVPYIQYPTTDTYKIAHHRLHDGRIVLTTLNGIHYAFDYIFPTSSWIQVIHSDIGGSPYTFCPIYASGFGSYFGFERNNIDLQLYYKSSLVSKAEPLERYPLSGAVMRINTSGHLMPLGNSRFCTVRCGYNRCPFTSPEGQCHIAVDVFSITPENFDLNRFGLKDLEYSSSAILEDGTPHVMMDIRGCFVVPARGDDLG